MRTFDGAHRHLFRRDAARGAERVVYQRRGARVLPVVHGTLLISLFSDNFTPKTLVVINKVCGVIIVFYGCKLLYSFLTMVF